MAEDLQVQFVKGNASMQDELIDFINYVFHLNGTDNDFYRSLPKLYKKEYHPCEANYITLENGRIVAAVGSYPGESTVGDTPLSFYGIGNVAVNPYCRSKGYMKKLMNMAVEDMFAREVDFSVLSGRRNRYAYFSYEMAGSKYCLWLDQANVKHANITMDGDYQFKQVKEEDTEVLREIDELQSKQPLRYYRASEKLLDILRSWQATVYSIYDAGSFAGYLVRYDKSVKEILLTQPVRIKEIVIAFASTEMKDGVTFELPEFQREYIDSIAELAENVTIQTVENFTVFNYKKVIEAYLKLKAVYEVLEDGKVTLLIHGKKKEEQLYIEVKNNTVTVADTRLTPDYEYSHLEAMSVLFQNYSPLRNQLPRNLKTWFPLPFYIYPADMV